jgi:leader peptidase (prepilin peptidase)/N-methyltransferase
VHLTPVWYACLTIFGLIFGSFFNVAIYRWPKEGKDHEWIKTPSHCPKCGAPIKWFDNVPVVSWLVLRGKCRNCGAPISPRYILVEAGTALLWLATAWVTTNHGLTGIPPDHVRPAHVICAVVFASLYLLTVIIDLETQLIPDEITVSHFATAWVFFFLARPDVVTPGWQSSVICMLALPAVFFGMAWLGWMGLGDVLLAAGFGVLFGWPLVAVVALLGFILGGLVAVPVMIRLMLRKEYKPGQHAIAFGPYLAISAFICLFCGRELIGWYLSLFGLKLLQNWQVVSAQSLQL